MKYIFSFPFSKVALVIGVLFIVSLGAMVWWIKYTIDYQASDYMLGFDEVIGSYDAALILGSKVYANGALGSVVRDRADMAIRLYKSSKVKKILVSADNRSDYYNETKAIYDYLLDNQIPQVDVFLDFAGFDTYDSMYRAKHNFLVTNVLIPNLITYCPRSLYLARSLGMDAYCVSMPRWFKPTGLWGHYRESLAKIKARFNIQFHSKAYFSGDDTYPISGSGNALMFY